MKQFFACKGIVTVAVVLLCSFFHLHSQEYNNFEVRYQSNLRGDLTLIGNHILNRDSGTAGEGPNDPYNNLLNDGSWSGANNDNSGFTNYNDYKQMQYIDVDGDPSTFSSSSANFTFPQADCNLIRYAALYWTATYPSETANGSFDGFTYNANNIPVGTGRQNDFDQIRFRVPGGSYVDITADEVLYDGFSSTEPSMRQNSPYACYADVTPLLTSLANPEGEYTVANVRATTGGLTPGGGSAAGWTLVIVYENPTLTGKLISTFDGFARVNGTNSVDIDYTGFETIPAGLVVADLGAATLEGDFRIDGDGLSIEASSNSGFTAIGNAGNPANNFFNSNITLDGVVTTNRNPASFNTLGYDTDLFQLDNPFNSLIPNGETGATFRFSTNGDQYYPFFNSFNVEVIEPNIVLEKRVEDIAGNDITGAGVNLGQLLDYVLTFQNLGNDHATNYTIRDILPINVTLDESSLNLPPGVTYVFDEPSRTITFTIPDNLIQENDPAYSIRMRVQVAENCFDFIDACTDLIENLAYSTYQGAVNTAVITDDPSVTDFDFCGYVVPGATNFLLDDLENCDFTRTVQLCGEDVLLDAGDNFDSYTWYIDENGDGLIDGGDTVITDGDPDNDPSTLLVNETGTYIVDKDVADPCKGFQEVIIVELFGATQSNPITALINDPTNTVEGDILICPNDGEELPQVFLCGLNDTELIQINIPDADSIVWEQLDEASCSAATEGCANKNNTCTWNSVGSGSNFTASSPGEFRLQINYEDGCFSRFYFNVFQNPLNPQYNSSDIICNTPGNITVTNMPVDYEFQLVDATNGTILVPYGTNPSFDIANNGAYRVEMRQQGVVDGCVFVLDNIGILDRDFQVDVTPRDAGCNGLGEISVSILNVEPQYYYELSQGGTTVDTSGPSDDNNYTFENLNPGTYDILATTDDGCTYTEQVTIQDVGDLNLTARVSQHITCREGNIIMSSNGGITPHTYAIWNFTDLNGVAQISYASPSDIPPSEFQTSQIFDILDPGQYVFVVIDRNNCFAFSNPVDIEFRPAADFDPTTVIDVQCFGDASGGIQFNLLDANGYQLTYYLYDASTFDENNYDYANALATNSSGNFPGLPAGDYAIVVNQRKGSASCDYIEYQTVSAPANAIIGDALLIQDYTCLHQGVIEVQNVSGGSAPYQYSIDGVTFGSNPTFTGLTDGVYTITIRDAAGCTLPTDSIVLAPLNPPTDLTFTATAPNCPDNSSDVTVNIVNGTAPFNIEIVSPSSIAATSISGGTATFDNLAPDTYTFRVTDNQGCVYSEDYTIAPLTPINAMGQSISNITCFDDTDGEARFTVSGFNTTYDYAIVGPATFNGTNETNTTIDLTGLDDGAYTITVTDNETNCTDTAIVTINAPPSILTLGVNETQPTCVADGSVVLTANGGWGGNSFEISYPDGTTTFTNGSGTFGNLNQSGPYSVSVTDANGCVATNSFVLNTPVAPTLQVAPNDFCYDDASGLTLTATVTAGGDGNFEYSLNNGPFGTNNIFTGLGPGTYRVDVRDGNGCTDFVDNIVVNPELSVTATAPNITACATDTDITITAAGGDGNYIYAVVGDGIAPVPGDFSSTNTVTVTGAGDYDVYVRDDNGGAGFCEASFDITIAQDPSLVITPAITDVSCFGNNDGSVTLAVTGGEAPYEYSIDNGANYQVSPNFFNLTAGAYTVRVRDTNNCDATLAISIDEPLQLAAEAQLTQNYTCLQLGEITVGSVTPTSGGSGSYQYSLNGGAWSAPTTGGITYTGLTNGTYAVQVRDANETSCLITLPNIVIDPLPTEPALTASVVYSCDGSGTVAILPNDPGYAYSLDGGAFQPSNVFTGIAPGDHIVTVNYGSECTTQASVLVEGGQALDAEITAFSDVSCNGGNDGSITFSVENFGPSGFEYQVNGGGFSAAQTAPVVVLLNNLVADNYVIDIQDAADNSCLITLNQTIAEPTPVVVSASLISPLTCVDGAVITTSASGGTPDYDYQLEDTFGSPIPGYDFATNGSNTTFAGLGAGDYLVRAQDTNGCIDILDSPISVVATTSVTFTSLPTACYSGANDGTIQVDISSGNGNYQFSLNGGPWMTPTPTTSTTYTFNNLNSGSYTIDVRDGFGCAGAQQTVTINDELIASIIPVDISTCGDGSITVNATGGSPTIQYAFVPTGNSPTGLFSGSNTFTVTAGNAGDYDVYVRDNSAVSPYCEYMETVTINPAVPLSVAAVPQDPECHDGLGAIDLNITSGISPFTLEIIDLDNGGASDQTITNVVESTRTFFNLSPGNYTINVTDATGCVVTETPINIANPEELTATVQGVTPSSCTGDVNDFGFQFVGYPATLGTIEFSDDGGATWIGDNSVPGTSDSFTGYTSGQTVYPAMRTVDGGGNTVCFTELEPFIVPYPLDDLDITILPIIVNCNELQVTVRGQNGSAPYEYAYSDDPANFNPATSVWTAPLPLGSTHTFVGLIPGRTYTFYVRDAVGCVRQSNVNVNNIITVPLEIASSITPSCSGSNNGSITYTITDNQAPFGNEIRWEVYDMSSGTATLVASSGGNIPYASPQNVTVNGLSPGNYFIEVTEVDGGVDSCVGATENQLLIELDPISGTPVVLQDITCDSPGLIEIQGLFGGGGIYTYTVTGPAPFSTISGTSDNPIEIPANSPGGTYNITIEDQYGCSMPLGSVNLNLSPNPTIDNITVDNCSVPTTVSINASSTAPPILYSIDGGVTYVDNGGIFNNIGPGTYFISIIDGNGCTDSGNVTIHPELQADVQLTKVLDCSGTPDAEITVENLIGSGNYDYEVSDSGGIIVARTNLPSDPFVITVNAADTYTISLFDNINTISCPKVFVIDVPAPILPNIAVTAFEDVSCLNADDGSITVNSTNTGIGPYTYEIVSGPGSSATFPIAPTSATATSATFLSLEGTAAGITYTIRVTADNTCFTETTQVIMQPDAISVPAPSIVEFGCPSGNNSNNATITINSSGITGGSNNFVIYEFIEEDDPNTAPVEPPVIVQSGSNPVYVETDLAGGTYTINVYDDNGCLGSTTAVIQPYDELLTASATVTNPLSCNPGMDGEITIAVTSTLGDSTRFEYSIDNGATYQASNVFPGLEAGTHNFLIRHIDTGCIITATETLTNPNTFTIDVNVINDVICFGTQTGEVTFELVDATYSGPISWEVFDTNGTIADRTDDTSVATGSFASNGPTSPATALFAGNYLVEVAQDNFPGCSNIEVFTIAGPPQDLTGDRDFADITCVPGNDGTIEIIDVVGGWGGYSYYVSTTANPDPNDPSNYVPNPRFENLSAGTYEIWIIDQEGCSEQLTDVTLTDPTPIVADLQINNYNCTNLQGEIEVVGVPAVNPVTGGQGSNYTYQLIRDGANVGSPQSNTVFTGLGAGSYQVFVEDQWGCNAMLGPVVLNDAMTATSEVVKPMDCTVNPGGEITINVTGGSSNLDYTVTFPDGTTTVSNNTGVFTNLTQVGEYVFVITDLDTATPCTYTVRQSLDAPVLPVLLDAAIENISCNGGTDGSILAVLDAATNDNPPYDYELIGISVGAPNRPLQNSPLFENLPAGDYQVRVVSSRGCEDIKNETITEPALLTASASATPFTCAPDNSVNTSTITVTAVDGTAPYLYSFNGGTFDASNSFELIDNGGLQTISYVVQDANGCEYLDNVIVQPLNTFVLNANQLVAIDCDNGAEQLELSVVESNPSGHTYTFALLPSGNPNGSFASSTATTATFELSAPGSYTFRATNDITGCYEETQYTIAPFDLIDVVATASSPVLCFGDANGVIEINVAGYSGDYRYQVYRQDGTPVGPSVNTDTSINPRPIAGLSGGNYYVNVEELSGSLCNDDSNIVGIASPDTALDAAPIEVANVSCDDNRGEILIDPQGGYLPYDIVLTNTITGNTYTQNGVTAHIFTGLSAGAFDIRITDAQGCIINRALNLVPPTPITAGIDATPTTLACYGDSNAVVAAINVTGGSGTYQYQLNEYDPTGTTIAFTGGAQSATTFAGLGAGIYSITVTDGWNCEVETAQVTISEPTEVMASLVQTSMLTCNTEAQMELTAVGGTAPYEFSVDGINFTAMNGSDTHTFSVGPGNYQYYVRDVFGCEANISNQVSIETVPPLNILIDDSAAMINCAGEASASIIANVTGGLGNYSYELYTDAALTNLYAGPQANNTFSGLPAGNYYVRVTSQDCEDVAPVVSIVNPLPLQIDREESTNVSCAGEEDGSITVEVSGGTGQILYAITPNLNQFDDVNVFTDLAPGTYDVIAQDENGCFIPFQFEIVAPDPLNVNTVQIAHEICEGGADGTIEIEIMGGTAPYRTALNTNDDANMVQDQTFFSGLAAGTYVVFVKDAQDCETNIIVEIDPGVNLNAVVEPVYECTGNLPENSLLVTLADESIEEDVLYALNTTDPAAMQLNPEFGTLPPGNHYLTIAHANGCINTVDFEIDAFEPLTLMLEQNTINEITAIASGGSPGYTYIFDGVDTGNDNTYYINRTDTFTVTVIDSLGCEVSAEIFMEFIDIEIPNYFTPDGDGTNDFWIPDNLEGFPDVLIKIYDRYGRVVAEVYEGHQGWDGNYQGYPLPTGDYWYVIRLNGENDDREFVGHFTLYR